MLIVEDDPATYTALRAILGRKGWDVTVATTLAGGGEFLDAAGAGAAGYACLILDLMLPDGDGAMLLRKVRQLKLPLRVLVTTGASDPARLSAVAGLNPDVLLRKPIDLGELLRGMRPDV